MMMVKKSNANNKILSLCSFCFVFFFLPLDPGFIEFEETIHIVKESVGKAEVKVLRSNGADGRVTVHYRTKDIDATATKDYQRKSIHVSICRTRNNRQIYLVSMIL